MIQAFIVSPFSPSASLQVFPCPMGQGNTWSEAEGRGFGGEFAEHAPRPPNGIPMQRNARTASEGEPASRLILLPVQHDRA